MNRYWFIAILALLSFALMGCGLTGGSVPIGNPKPARLIGTVVDEQNPSVPIADAEVEVVTEDGRVFTARTDTNGQFIVEVPKGKKCSVRVRPPMPMMLMFREHATDVLIDEDEVRVVVPMLREGTPQIPMITQLSIEPETVTVRVGEQVQFRFIADLSFSLRPVWTVHGGIGVITADGVFTATRPGHGRVTVRLRELRAQADVTVLSAGEEKSHHLK